MRDSSDMCKKIGCNIKALMMQLSTELFPFRTCARLVTTTVAKDSVQSVARVAAASTRTTATSASSRSRHPGSGSSSSSEHQYQQRWCDWNEPAVRKRTTSASVPESSEAQARMARAGGLGCSSTGACAVPQPGKAPQFRSPNCTCTYIYMYICIYIYTHTTTSNSNLNYHSEIDNDGENQANDNGRPRFCPDHPRLGVGHLEGADTLTRTQKWGRGFRACFRSSTLTVRARRSKSPFRRSPSCETPPWSCSRRLLWVGEAPQAL